MPNQDKLISNLEHRNRVSISPKNFTKKVRISLFIFLNAAFLLSILVYFSSFSKIEKLTLIATLFLLALGVFYFCTKKIRTTIVKGDTLILKSIINHSNKVTSLRSIKNVKTRTFLGLQWTHLDYSLDGHAENIIFIGHSSSLPNTPEQTIKKAVNWSKKRKANLKPGPVSAN